MTAGFSSGAGFRSGAAALVVALVAPIALAFVGLVALAAPAEAVIVRPFDIRYQKNDTGDILLRGNSLVTCPPSAACTDAINRVGTGNAINNNGYAMQFVDIDTDPTTSSSSSAQLSLPAGATVSYAGLYWSGYTGGGSRTAPPGTTFKNKLMLKAPGDANYRTVTAAPSTPTNPVDGASTGAPYVSFAEVTSIVQSAGAGTYTGANIFAAIGTDAYAAWTMVVVVHSSSYPQRKLIVFDGFGTIQGTPTSDNTLDIPLTGLSTPPSGAVDVRLGAVVYEGDAGSVGDSFQFVAPPVAPATTGVITTLSDAQNPSNNAFNSTVSDAAAMVAGRIPDGNTFGFDADVFESSILIGNAATTATLRMTTGGETFFPAVATFVSNIYAPRLDVTRSATVVDVDNNNRTRTGDRITYTVDVTNNGSDDSTDTRVAEAIPAGTTYVPGSLTVDGTTNSSRGELTGSTLNVRLGSSPGGAGGAGGAMSPVTATKHTQYSFTVEITAPFLAGGSITGSTPITYSDASSRSFSGSSTITTTTVDPATADLAVTQTVSPTQIQITDSHTVTWTATVTNNGPDPDTAPVLTEVLPTGVTAVSVSGATCTSTGTTYTCPLSTLAKNATSVVTFTATLRTTPSNPSNATASIAGADTDPSTGNNATMTGVAVNTAPVALGDSAPLNAPSTQIDIDVLANDTDANPADVLAISAVTTPGHGTATITAGGKVRYVLTDTAFIGTDTFTYTVSDGRGGTATASVSVPVNNHRSSDLAVTHTASPTTIQRGGSTTVTWTATVTNNGPQDEPNPVLVESLPTGATGVTVIGATCTGGGTTLTCPLAALTNGVSTVVTFTATLAGTPTDPSTAIATVHGDSTDPTSANNTASAPVAVNAAPVAAADSAPLNAPSTQIDIDVLNNDSDTDTADTLTISAVTVPGHGTATITSGKVRYVLIDMVFIGTDTFSYTVSDGRGGTDTATVSVAVGNHRSADLAVTQTASPTTVQRAGRTTVTWTATVTNNGPQGEPNPVLVEDLPTGVTGVSVSGATCSTTGTTLTCPLAALTNGASTAVTFTATLAGTPTDPSTAIATVHGDGTDPTLADNTASTPVAVNAAPVAVADSRALNTPSTQVDINVLANDSDPDAADTLTISAVSAPGHGTASIVAGKVRYLLTDTAFIGTDTFTYTISDGRGGTDIGTVNVPVNNHGTADLAVTHTASPTTVQRGGSTTVTWTATVTNNGPQAEPVPVLVEGLPTGATGVSVVGATCSGSGRTLTCPLAALANGASTVVTFTATLAGTAVDPSTAVATVHGDSADPTSANDTDSASVVVNAAPTATADLAALNTPSTQIDINVLANDSDPDTADTLDITAVTTPAHGTATIVAGKIRYVLTDPTFVGPDSFDYTVCDGRGGCDTGTVTVPVNDHRRADLSVGQVASPTVVQRGAPAAVTWTVTITNHGPQAEPSPVLVEDLPAGLTGISVVGATCTVVVNQYTCTLGPLANGATTVVSFTATIPPTAPDPMTATATASGSIADPNAADNSVVSSIGVNLSPIAAADTATLGSSAVSIDVDVLGNDRDPDGDPLTITTVTTPAHGTAVVVNGKIHYTLTDFAFVGNELVNYTVCDGRSGCATATVTIAVADHDVADLQVTQTSTPKLLQRNGSRISTWTVTIHNAGPEAEPRPVLVETLPLGVSVIDVSVTGCATVGVTLTCPLPALANGASTQITFIVTLPAGTTGPARATAEVTGVAVDPVPADNTASASVALNTAPVADNDAAILATSATTVTVDALDGDVDADGDPLTLSSVQKPKHGTARIVAGKILYTLTDLDFVGAERFSYVVCDDRSGCSTAYITVQVAAHGGPPVAVADSATILPGQVAIIDVVANDHDPDGDSLKPTRITMVPKHGTAVLRSGRLRYTPAAGFTGIDTLQYEVCDPSGNCDRATVTVHVTSNPPVAAPDTGTVKPGGTTVISVLDNDVDPAGYQLGDVVITKQPSSGVATVNDDGTISYQADGAAQAGSKVTIGYRACDATGACADGTLVLTVAGAADTGGDLAYTGGDLGPLMLIALSLMVLGGLIVGRVRQVLRSQSAGSSSRPSSSRP
jgi:uncharacterized repeat protein (TIGR01451 family)